MSRSNKYFPIIYKLLNDALFILVGFFFFVMIAESLLPDIISRYIPIYFFALAILLDILLISIVRKRADAKEAKILNKKTINIFLIVSALVLVNGILKFHPLLIFIITILAVTSIYLIYNILEKESD